ncbi:MAG: hypothetical protein U0V87_10515 [Acidobacteriota bacterium]
MKKKNTIAVLAGLLALTAGAALAGTPFSSSVHNTPSAVPGGTVFQRYFAALASGVSPDCSTNCGAGGCVTTDGQQTCQLTTRNSAGAYLGYDSNSDNYFPAGTGDGNTFQALLEAQGGAGTSGHIGYYGWTSKVVLSTDQSKKNVADCTGTNAASCLGNANSTNSRDISGVPNADGGAAGTQRFGGLSPVPAPRVTSYSPATGITNLGWDAAVSNTGSLTAVSYDLHFFKGACNINPNETQFTLLKNVTGTSTTVANADVGAGPSDCVTYALRPVLANIVGGTVKTRFLSSNSQQVRVSGSGGAATVFDISAKWASANNVEVNWKTSLEDGVRGFYVSRATTENGTYVRVSSLIAAKGEASAYTFVDAVQVQGIQKASGLFYKIETVDIDDNVAAFGPAKAQLPVPGKGVIQQRNKTNRK